MTAQQIIIGKYGLPGAEYENKFMEVWQVAAQFDWFNKVINSATGKGTEKIYLNRDFKNKLIEAFKMLECNGAYKEIKTFDGCYQIRKVRGAISTSSLHSWGMAIDLNAAKEKLGQEKTFWSNKFINTMLDAGLFWGGSWKSRKDSMHFALYNG